MTADEPTRMRDAVGHPTNVYRWRVAGSARNFRIERVDQLWGERIAAQNNQPFALAVCPVVGTEASRIPSRKLAEQLAEALSAAYWYGRQQGRPGTAAP